MTVDLFGDPPPPPAKNTTGYLEHLAQLTYPDGATFWCLALGRLPPGLAAAEYDAIWLRTKRGQMLHAVVEIATGKIIKTEEAASGADQVG